MSSVAEALDRWRADDRVQVLRSEFLDVLATVPDPRDRRGRRYPLGALLAIAVLATAAGMRGYAGFATWARTAPEDVLAQLGIRFRRPSEKTFRAVFSRVDPDDLNRRLGAYFTAHATRLDPAGLVPIALDGKTLRGALRAKATATHLVSVFAHRARLVLGQLRGRRARAHVTYCSFSATAKLAQHQPGTVGEHRHQVGGGGLRAQCAPQGLAVEVQSAPARPGPAGSHAR